MTRDEAKEMLPIIQAFAEGKDIEYRSKGFNEDWKKVTQIPALSFKSFEYRIKPEPTYRPFANAEECWCEMLKHEPFGWVIRNDYHVNIANLIRQSITFADNEGRNSSFSELLEDCTFADETKFGIKED